MNMIFQDITTTKLYIQENYSNNSLRRLSSVFSYLRNRECYSFFGDYPIIAFIISIAKIKGKNIGVKEISRVFRKSAELKQYARVNNILVKNLAMKEKL